MAIGSLFGLTVFSVVSAVYTVSGPCTETWRKFNDECIWFSKEKATWINTHSWCNLFKGGLVGGLDTAYSRNIIARMINEDIARTSSSPTVKYWIGLSDMKCGGQCKWMLPKFQANVTISEAGGEPKADDTGKCVYIDEHGDLYTDKCKTKHLFICIRDTWI